jgi:hypothetical protein
LAGQLWATAVPPSQNAPCIPRTRTASAHALRILSPDRYIIRRPWRRQSQQRPP